MLPPWLPAPAQPRQHQLGGLQAALQYGLQQRKQPKQNTQTEQNTDEGPAAPEKEGVVAGVEGGTSEAPHPSVALVGELRALGTLRAELRSSLLLQEGGECFERTEAYTRPAAIRARQQQLGFIASELERLVQYRLGDSNSTAQTGVAVHPEQQRSLCNLLHGMAAQVRDAQAHSVALDTLADLPHAELDAVLAKLHTQVSTQQRYGVALDQTRTALINIYNDHYQAQPTPQ